jgi:hypothetical protein
MLLTFDNARALEELMSLNEYERAEMLQTVLMSQATGGGPSDVHYKALRREFVDNVVLRGRVPRFVKTCRSLSDFWGYIQPKFPTYQERRAHIRKEFEPLLEYLENPAASPADATIADTLSSFDSEGVHAVWQKALDRRQSDPEGAITSARTLLETACKRILDDAGQTYGDTEELPKLYHMAAEQMNLAPSQHSEAALKTILGNCQSVVGGLASLRNKIGDAHGRGGNPVKVRARHAALAVNLAGSMATFLVETWGEARERKTLGR